MNKTIFQFDMIVLLLLSEQYAYRFFKCVMCAESDLWIDVADLALVSSNPRCLHIFVLSYKHHDQTFPEISVILYTSLLSSIRTARVIFYLHPNCL